MLYDPALDCSSQSFEKTLMPVNAIKMLVVGVRFEVYFRHVLSNDRVDNSPEQAS